MTAIADVLSLLEEVLSLQGRSQGFTANTPLLGALPELDSMAVVDLIGAMEQRWGFAVDDGDIDGHTFATVASLAAFIEERRPS